MKRSILTAASLAAILWFGTSPALAQRPSGGQGRGPGAGASGSHVPMGGNAPSMGKSGNAPANTNASSHASSSSPTDLLTRNTHLDSTLTSNLQSKGLIPAGADLKDVCNGFKNLGLCMASIHVSHNLNLSFDCVKADVTGTAPAAGATCPDGTGASKMSLGKTIQTLSPNANASAELKKANKAAKADIQEAEAQAQTKSS